jgi:hypothetical protein
MYRDKILALKTHLAGTGEFIILVKYEHLTSDPERELKRVCDFVGSSYSDVLLSEDAVSVTGYNKSMANVDHLLSQRIQARASAWRQYISSESVVVIETKLKSELAWLGYRSVLEDS